MNGVNRDVSHIVLDSKWMLFPGVDVNLRVILTFFCFLSFSSCILLKFQLYFRNAHGISIFVGLRADSFSFLSGTILFVSLFCYVCSPKKLPCPPATLGHKMDSFSFQMVCQLLLSELVTNCCLRQASSAMLGSLGIFKTGDLLLEPGIRMSETNEPQKLI